MNYLDERNKTKDKEENIADKESMMMGCSFILVFTFLVVLVSYGVGKYSNELEELGCSDTYILTTIIISIGLIYLFVMKKIKKIYDIACQNIQ